MEILYFPLQYAIDQHDYILQVSGGKFGIKDVGQLESMLFHIRNDDYYPNFEKKLTHLVFGVSKFHTFTDGNKRTAIALGAYFLELNGYSYCVAAFIRELENIIVWVAENKVDKQLLFEIISSILYEDDYAEELKLKIYNSINDTVPN